MSDIMKPMSFARLMTWALSEHDNEGTVFGVKKSVTYGPEDSFELFGGRIEAPFGPAAGPNAQLAQNLVAGYYAGARYFELKTVQVMDGAEMRACIPKPCITPGDVCYNCEWSTELTCVEAAAEYIKGWFACKLLSREWGLGADDGFIFNMSVGYNLEGIKSEKVDTFIESLKDASNTAAWDECRTWTLAHLDRFRNVDEAFVESITPHVSTSMTISTMHGCPAEQSEAIAAYLIVEKGLDTCVKVNPTLSGYDVVRDRLNALGYDAMSLSRESFDNDLQWDDAKVMLKNLARTAEEHGRRFGVKICNTLPVNVVFHELPSEEMYMSGVALYPLAANVAEKIAREFDGRVHLSFSAGVDEKNVNGLVDAGIWPVTVATSLLRPCGYERFSRMAKNVERKAFAGERTVDIEAIHALNEESMTSGAFRKPEHGQSRRQLSAELPLLDCLACSACATVCPNRANMVIDVPGFMRRQIIHIDGMCNECGNCAVFCPYEGRPYRHKLTVFWTLEDMNASANDGFMAMDSGAFRVRYKGACGVYDIDDVECGLPRDLCEVIAAVRDNYSYVLVEPAE